MKNVDRRSDLYFNHPHARAKRGARAIAIRAGDARAAMIRRAIFALSGGLLAAAALAAAALKSAGIAP